MYTGQLHKADDETCEGNDVQLECTGKQANQNAKQDIDTFVTGEIAL